MRKLLLAAFIAGAASTPALAQPAAGDSPFTGLRLEGLVGYDSIGFSGEDDVDDIGGDDSLEGATYGIGVGFDADLGGVVAGAEVELTESSGDFDFDDDEVTAGLDAGRDIYVGGRLGFVASPNVLIYGKAGYTNLKLRANASDGVTTFRGSDEVDGYRLGGGAEFLFGPNTYGKVEYRYSNYGSFDNNSDVLGDLDMDRHQIVAGVGFRF
jgi:outer membrane immunogenic protein